jgi:glycosyltransferase involved in cell wall biosynthesis
VHVQTRGLARLGMRVARALGVPYVLTVHDFLEPGQRLPIDPMRCKRIIAVSDAVRCGLMETAGIAEDLVTVIPSGVDVPRSLAGPAPNAPRRVPVIGTAGPLERIKGHQFFLEAARRVLDAGIEAEFVVAGSGQEEAFLRRLSKSLGITEHVTFAPHVREYIDVLEALDIFVLPSLQQGLGTVMIEAMALQKPVIAARVGGVQSVVRDGETGLLVPSGDVIALAEAMIRLLRCPAEAARLGSAGRALVTRDFNVEQMAGRTAELYRQVVEVS